MSGVGQAGVWVACPPPSRDLSFVQHVSSQHKSMKLQVLFLSQHRRFNFRSHFLFSRVAQISSLGHVTNPKCLCTSCPGTR